MPSDADFEVAITEAIKGVAQDSQAMLDNYLSLVSFTVMKDDGTMERRLVVADSGLYAEQAAGMAKILERYANHFVDGVLFGAYDDEDEVED